MSKLRDRAWHSMPTSLDARNEARHRWYWVKEGFSPLLVQSAIEAELCCPTDLVVDPFCGSGTVPLEALRRQMSTAGAEVNPFWRLRRMLRHSLPRKPWLQPGMTGRDKLSSRAHILPW